MTVVIALLGNFLQPSSIQKAVIPFKFCNSLLVSMQELTFDFIEAKNDRLPEVVKQLSNEVESPKLQQDNTYIIPDKHRYTSLNRTPHLTLGDSLFLIPCSPTGFGEGLSNLLSAILYWYIEWCCFRRKGCLFLDPRLNQGLTERNQLQRISKCSPQCCTKLSTSQYCTISDNCNEIHRQKWDQMIKDTQLYTAV